MRCSISRLLPYCPPQRKVLLHIPGFARAQASQRFHHRCLHLRASGSPSAYPFDYPLHCQKDATTTNLSIRLSLSIQVSLSLFSCLLKKCWAHIRRRCNSAKMSEILTELQQENSLLNTSRGRRFRLIGTALIQCLNSFWSSGNLGGSLYTKGKHDRC